MIASKIYPKINFCILYCTVKPKIFLKVCAFILKILLKYIDYQLLDDNYLNNLKIQKERIIAILSIFLDKCYKLTY
jgi:hypothetical protein